MLIMLDFHVLLQHIRSNKYFVADITAESTFTSSMCFGVAPKALPCRKIATCYVEVENRISCRIK
jgi:hypothetical protein